MVTKEQVRQARQTNLVQYLQARGEDVRKEGKNFRLPGHGGLLISGNKYWHASSGKGGNAIDFLVEVEKMPFLKAIEELLGGKEGHNNPLKKEPGAIKATDSLPTLPTRANKNNRVIAYLTQTRKIPAAIVLGCIRKKILYQDFKGNAVFPCWPAGAIIEGTLSQVRYKQRIGSGIWILACETGTNVAVVESPIDALSLTTLRPEVGTIVALGGTCSERALLAFLGGLKHKKVYLALDNDKAGQEANLKLSEKISFPEILKPLKPEKKDWNEDLIARFLK